MHSFTPLWSRSSHKLGQTVVSEEQLLHDTLYQVPHISSALHLSGDPLRATVHLQGEAGCAVQGAAIL